MKTCFGAYFLIIMFLTSSLFLSPALARPQRAPAVSDASCFRRRNVIFCPPSESEGDDRKSSEPAENNKMVYKGENIKP